MPLLMKVKPMKDMLGPTVVGSGKAAKAQLPEVTIPIKPEWLKKFATGDDIEVTLCGKVTSTRTHDPEKPYARNELTLEVSDVEVAYEESFSELADEQEDAADSGDDEAAEGE